MGRSAPRRVLSKFPEGLWPRAALARRLTPPRPGGPLAARHQKTPSEVRPYPDCLGGEEVVDMAFTANPLV